MLTEFFQELQGYPGLGLLCATSGIAVPFPEDVALLWAGVQVREGALTWAPTLATATAGVLVRDLIAFGAGRLLEEWLLESAWAKRLLGAKKLHRAQRLVASHGALAVLFGRFLVGFRAPVFLVAGATRVSLRKFVAWDLLGLVLTVPTVVLIGYYAGDPILELAHWTLNRTRWIGAALVLLGLVYVGWRVRNVRGDDGPGAEDEAEGDAEDG